MSDGKVVFKYVGDTTGIDRANAEAEGKISGLGSKLAGITAKAVAAIGAAAVAAGTAIVKIGSDFESAFAGVIKTVDATEEQFADLREGILEMSKTIPATAVEIAGVAEAAGQLGIAVENIEGFTRSMIDLGESTNMAANEAATQLARFANIMQMPQDQFDRLGSVIVDLGNNSATTEAEIVSMGMRLAGAGKQAKMSEADVMGFAAALSSVGIEAEAGGTAMSRVITNINIAVQTGSENLEQYASVAGMSAEAFKKAFRDDAAGAVAAFITGLGEMESKGGSTILMLEEMGISEIRMRDALLRASGAGDLLTRSIELGNNAWEENIALTKEAEQRYQTLESRFDMLKNQIAAVAIEIYDNMRPALSDVLKSFSDLFTEIEGNGALDTLSDTLGTLAGTLADSLAAILPIILELINEILPPLMQLVDTILPYLVQAFEAIMPIIKEFAQSVLPQLAKMFETLLPPAQKIADEVFGIFLMIFEKLNPVINELIDGILPPLASILDTIGELIGIIAPILGVVIDLLKPLIELLGTGLAVVLGVIADALSIIVGLIGLIIEGIKWLLGNKADFDTYLNMIKKPFTSDGSVVSAIGAAQGKIDKNAYSEWEKYREGDLRAIRGGRGGSSGMYSLAPDDYLSDEEWYNKYFGNNARGTASWKGGYTWVGEEGPEIIDLPAGTRIYPADVSARMASAPSISNNSASSVINELKVYPDSAEYMRILRLLEASDRARQASRAAGGN